MKAKQEPFYRDKVMLSLVRISSERIAEQHVRPRS